MNNNKSIILVTGSIIFIVGIVTILTFVRSDSRQNEIATNNEPGKFKDDKPKEVNIQKIESKDSKSGEEINEKKEVYEIEGNSLIENTEVGVKVVVQDIFELKGFPLDVPKYEPYSGKPISLYVVAYSKVFEKVALSKAPYEGSGMAEVYLLDIASLQTGMTLIPDFLISISRDAASHSRSLLVGRSKAQENTAMIFDLAQVNPKEVYTAPKDKTLMTRSVYGDDYMQIRWQVDAPSIEVFRKIDWDTFDPNRQETYPNPEIVKLPMK